MSENPHADLMTFLEAERARGVTEQERELINAAIHYVKVAQDLSLSAYIRENGRHGRKSPWAELVDAVNAMKPST